MVVEVRSLNGEEEKELNLPEIFESEVRRDIIKRSFLSSQSAKKQSKGSNPRAGMETTAETPSKGSGQTRVRRIQGRGYDAAGRAAWAPFTYGGRRAHPPKSEKDIEEKINKKEKNLAARSAISATKELSLVESRGHEINDIENLPIVVEDDFEAIDRTREVKEVLESLGVWGDVERVKKGRNIRSGRGKSRNRKYRKKTGPLIIVCEDKGIFRGARNIPGVDVVTTGEINVEILAPGGNPGRLTIWTESAIDDVNRRFLS